MSKKKSKKKKNKKVGPKIMKKKKKLSPKQENTRITIGRMGKHGRKTKEIKQVFCDDIPAM